MILAFLALSVATCFSQSPRTLLATGVETSRGYNFNVGQSGSELILTKGYFTATGNMLNIHNSPGKSLKYRWDATKQINGDNMNIYKGTNTTSCVIIVDDVLMIVNSDLTVTQYYGTLSNSRKL